MKHEAPPLRMKVLNGTLLPTSAWDQERIDSYRNGSIMNVHITQEKNRKLERKYWAILHRVVAQCPVRQRTAEDLHKAIRLKLGIVDAFWTIDGRLRVEIKSTSTMEDPEYSAFYEEAMALLQEITGVNPETLSAESADVGEDEQETPTAMPHIASGEGSDGDPQGTPPAQAVAADEVPAAADQTEEGAPESSEPEKPAHGEQAAPSSVLDPVKRMLMEECIDNMLRDAFGDPAIDRPAKVDKLRDVFLEKQNLGDFPDFVNRCHETARRVIGKPAERDRAKEYLLGKIPA